MAAKKTHVLRNVLLAAVVCAIVITTVFAARDYTANEQTYASSVIQFSFDGAASGIAPNGAVFDIGEIRSDAVLAEALNAAGMADRYTAEEIRAQLEINGSYPDDINQQLMGYDSLLDFSANRAYSPESYYPTLFTVKLYSDFDKSVSSADLQKLVQSIMASYEAYFMKVYAVSAQSDEIGYDLSEFDYPQRLVILSMVMEQSRTYAEELYEKAPQFLYGGYGFNDISVRLGNLIDNDVARLQANISISAITRHTDRLLNQYRYEIKNLTNSLEKQNKCLAALDQLIASYDKNDIIYLSSTDSLTKIDGNSSETYDALVAERKEVADGITQIITRINNYNLLLDDLMKTGQTEQVSDGETAEEAEDEAYAAVVELTQEEIDKIAKDAQAEAAQKMAELDDSINTLVVKYKAIMADFSSLISSYNEQTLNASSVEILSGVYYTPRLFSLRFAVKLVKTAAPVCFCFIVLLLVLVIMNKKKQNAM